MYGLSSDPRDRPALRALFTALIDDAAVFPPRGATLADAVRLHQEHRRSWYADLVGPLLVPAAAAASVIDLFADAPGCRVGVIARPGTPASDVLAALALLQPAGVEVAGVEMGWTSQWRDTGMGALPLSLEVPRGETQLGAVADIAGAAEAGRAVQAKFRTGATVTWAWPDETEFATFIATAIEHDVAFKLTGGLHHAVRGDHDGDTQHGLLNVIATVHRARAGERADALVAVLSERDPTVLTTMIATMSDGDILAVRESFTSYGCCDVTDPIGELAAAALVAAT